ncbi:MAG: LLM class flavin-dependent oxidoreductase [Actinobacteria bacterium]|nr:LLM class flavin-dependent oxidoreductase [Actinomycetota bacterium]
MSSSPHIGVMLPRDLPIAQVLPFARRADERGFAELWVVEDLGFRGGIAQAAAVLASTTHITVGIGILPAGARNAAFTAMELATLAQLFPHRVIAGIGHGMPDWMRQVGAWPQSPLTLLAEYTTAVRALLHGAPGPTAGRYVNVEGVVLSEIPDAVPPVVLGVRGPKSLAVAGRTADGAVLAEPAVPGYVAASLDIVRGAAPSGRELMLTTYDVAVVEDDAETAIAEARPATAMFGEPDWAPHLVGLDFADDLARHRQGCASPEEFAATIPAEWVAALTLAGTPDQVRAGIATRGAAGATSVILTPVGVDRMRAMERLAEVLP